MPSVPFEPLLETSKKRLNQMTVRESQKDKREDSKPDSLSIYEESRDAIYTDARDVFGQTVQTIVCIEELSELQKELCKALRKQECPDHIAEEIADVQITTEQMEAAYNLTEKVKLYRKYKLKRLQERIEQVEWEREHG